MRNLLRKFLKDSGGAIAVETALLTPLLIFILLPAVDLGLQVVTLQKMNQSADSGVAYVVNGGRNEAKLRNIVQDSFGRPIGLTDLVVEATCACVIAGTTSSGEDGEGTTVTDGSEPASQDPDDPYAAYYLKTATNLSDEMCSVTCNDGSQSSALVNVAFSQNVSGVWKSKTISTHLQTRIK